MPLNVEQDTLQLLSGVSASGVTNKNITGSTTGTFSIYSNSISNAYFANVTNNQLSAKDYTGEAVTYTSEELGALKILNNTTNKVETIAPADYEITYSKILMPVQILLN